MGTQSYEQFVVKPVKGFRMGTAMAGIKRLERRDLVVMNWDEGSSVAGVFTLNRFCAAPVQISRDRIGGNPLYFLINSGNANAGTGDEGLAAALSTTSYLAKLSGVDESQILPFSTGVIGVQIPVNKICDGMREAMDELREDNWHLAAEGIMTTDSCPKGRSQTFEHDGKVYTVTGICKGAGMIKPNMGTMLAYIATDAAVGKEFLQSLLVKISNQSFNRITIDGDTSTNDSFMAVATGAAGNAAINSPDAKLAIKLEDAFTSVAVDLAKDIVRDGEGATKFVTVKVEDAASNQDALEVAYTIAHSPLVKTALFASDPNWGRILAAVGRADVKELSINRVSIWLNHVAIVDNGQPAPGYTEEDGQQVMNQKEILIRISLGVGSATEEIWTTDLSYEYVKINAEYRS